MKAYAAARIEISISVVDFMKAPEKRHDVKQPVLPIDQHIQNDDRERRLHPNRQGGGVKQAPAALRANRVTAWR